MVIQLINTLKVSVSKGHERTVKAKKHIIYSLFIKGISIVIGLLFVPLILNYLDAERYGIWLTLSSIIGWASFFDVGLGNGLRNRFAEAIANNDHQLARTYVSTTYAFLGGLLLSVLLLFYCINPFLNWQRILNTHTIGSNELSLIALIIFTFFILRFFFNLIGVILLANQRPAINNSFGPIGNLLSISIIYILTKTTDGSLINLAFVLSVLPVLVLAVASLFFFKKDYKQYRPAFRYVDLSKAKDLLGLGIKFFYFQISAIIFFSTTNFLIAQFADQTAVAAYNISYKLLFMVNMVYGIILTPFWSAITEAQTRGDFPWLKRILRKLNLLSLIMTIGLLILLFISPFIYKFWIGNKVDIPFSLNLIIAVYLAQQLFIAPFSNFINGLGKLRLGMYVITVKLLLFIPLAFFLGSKYAANGVVLSMFLIQLPSLILEPVQVYKLVNQKANGIWNR